nr:pyruvate dehydrogenase (acetyl-transferring) E1 component subunit alpha [Xanthomonadales bacterium]
AQTGAETLAQKGLAGGLQCVQVDGNDVIAMLAVMQETIARARRGEGGTVVEAVTYRLSDHTTADDARRYRPDDEVKQAWDREPMRRLRRYLEALGVWDEAREQAWKEQCGREVDIEVNAYLETRSQPIESIFDYLYAEAPHDIAAQRAEAMAWEEGRRHG